MAVIKSVRKTCQEQEWKECLRVVCSAARAGRGKGNSSELSAHLLKSKKPTQRQ